MNKSSNVKSIRVKEEKSKKTPVIEFDLKSVNLQEVIQMGLQSFMFDVGMIAVQQAMAAEVGTLAVRDMPEPQEMSCSGGESSRDSFT